MNLFGRQLFGFKKDPEPMYDFAQHGLVQKTYGMENFIRFDGIVEQAPSTKRGRKTKQVAPPPEISPKDLFEMKALNKNEFKVNANADYLDAQIRFVKDKLDLLGKPPKEKKTRGVGLLTEPSPMYEMGDKKYGRMELESILERLVNRRRLAEFTGVLESYPHTTSEKIQEVVNAHSNLECRVASGFVPDFPREAVTAMKEYDAMCVELCNKKAVFYVIAETKDFQVKNKRRDPILLAQSPFGFFWQILGAWDKEMVYLADL